MTCKILQCLNIKGHCKAIRKRVLIAYCMISGECSYTNLGLSTHRSVLENVLIIIEWNWQIVFWCRKVLLSWKYNHVENICVYCVSSFSFLFKVSYSNFCFLLLQSLCIVYHYSLLLVVWFIMSILWTLDTTRPIQSDEIHGTDYYFISKEDMDRESHQDSLLECIEQGGFMYGIAYNTVKRIIESNYIPILKLHPQV